MTFKLIVTILLFGSLVATAQPVDSLVGRVLQQNLTLQILEKEYDAALEKIPQVGQMPDPEVGLGAFPLPVETRLGAQWVRISASQAFYWKDWRKGKKDLERSKAQALYERIDAQALELAYQLKQAWYRLYQMEQSQRILRKNLNLLRSLEQLSITKVESNDATTADVLRVQLKIEELLQELTILEKNKTQPRVTINQLLQRPLATPVQVADTLAFASLPYDPSILQTQIASSHPMLRLFERQQEIARQAIQVNQLDGKPRFGVGLDYIVVAQRGDFQPANNGRDIVQLRGTCKIPLYRQQYAAKEREEQIKIAALEQQKTETISQFMAMIEKAKTDYETARLKMELYDRQLEIIRSAVRILTTSYSAEGSEFDELLRLEQEQYDYELKRLKAIVDSHLAKSAIEKYLMNQKADNYE